MSIFDLSFDFTFNGGGYASFLNRTMAGCAITSGIQSTCSDLKKVGGVKKNFYVGNLDELGTPKYSVDGSGYVVGFQFPAYAGLYKFTTKKLTGSAGWEFAAGAGASSFNHSVVQKLFSESPNANTVIEQLANSDVFVIIEDNSGNFKLYGGENGLAMSAGTQNSGINFGDDTGVNVTFTGAETTLPKYVKKGASSDSTRDYLDSLVVG